MKALGDACASEEFPAEVAVVISNEPEADGLQHARGLGIETAVVDHRGKSRDAFEGELIEVLQRHRADLVCLAGFMRLLSARFVEAYRGRVLNVHPSLLPAFPGLHATRQALEQGVRVAGCTVHVVVEEMDAGPIVLQAAVPVEADDIEESLSARVLEQEHRIYPEAVRLFAEGRVRVEGRRTRIC